MAVPLEDPGHSISSATLMAKDLILKIPEKLFSGQIMALTITPRNPGTTNPIHAAS